MPTILPKKIYIIDEVHNLSAAAFDALLKTIEEPPEHWLFIFCTPEMYKIPATIRSRCSIYQFRTISIDVICGRLSFVLTEMGKQYEDDAIKLIAKQADGSMRDACCTDGSVLVYLIKCCNIKLPQSGTAVLLQQIRVLEEKYSIMNAVLCIKKMPTKLN